MICFPSGISLQNLFTITTSCRRINVAGSYRIHMYIYNHIIHTYICIHTYTQARIEGFHFSWNQLMQEGFRFGNSGIEQLQNLIGSAQTREIYKQTPIATSASHHGKLVCLKMWYAHRLGPKDFSVFATCSNKSRIRVGPFFHVCANVYNIYIYIHQLRSQCSQPCLYKP